jgi:TolA-binding protein
MVFEQRRPSRLPCCRRSVVGVVNGDNLTKDELLSRFLQMEERIDELEEKLYQKDEQIREQDHHVNWSTEMRKIRDTYRATPHLACECGHP